MTTWTLIITLCTSHGVAVAPVPGFKTVQECQAAYEVYKKSAKSYFIDIGGACVPQTKDKP